MRVGTVAIVGRPNVGKSTLLNMSLGEPLAAVSPLPQTTRQPLLGVVHREGSQIAFVDTPGLHRPRTELGRRMNASAVDAFETADLVVFMADTQSRPAERRRGQPESTPRSPGVHPVDAALVGLLPTRARVLLVINKVDRLRDKSLLLPQIAAFQRCREFVDIVPVSLLDLADVERVLAAVEKALPEGEPLHDSDTLTDRPLVFFIQEYIREQVLLLTEHEVPHAVAVSIDTIEETRTSLRIAATIHVEKAGQKKIIVGRGGSTLRRLGIEARRRIKQLTEAQVHLSLFVRVSSGWRSAPRQLTELGYDAPAQPELGHILLDAPVRSGAGRRQ